MEETRVIVDLFLAGKNRQRLELVPDKFLRSWFVAECRLDGGLATVQIYERDRVTDDREKMIYEVTREMAIYISLWAGTYKGVTIPISDWDTWGSVSKRIRLPAPATFPGKPLATPGYITVGLRFVEWVGPKPESVVEHTASE